MDNVGWKTEHKLRQISNPATPEYTGEKEKQRNGNKISKNMQHEGLPPPLLTWLSADAGRLNPRTYRKKL